MGEKKKKNGDTAFPREALEGIARLFDKTKDMMITPAVGLYRASEIAKQALKAEEESK
jgi:hypothetical protein